MMFNSEWGPIIAGLVILAAARVVVWMLVGM